MILADQKFTVTRRKLFSMGKMALATRKILGVVLCVVACLCVIPLASAKKGVVFVHGRGNAQLSNPCVALAYWGNLVNTSTRHEAVSTKVVHYSGTDSLTSVAPLVAQQIVDFVEQNGVGTNELRVYAHSYGGIVMRYIFSNGATHGRYQKVIEASLDVTTIGTPHLGSEAADLAYQWDVQGNALKKTLMNSDEYLKNNASAREMRTAQMAYYNQNCILWGTRGCPLLPKPFFMISGGKEELTNDFWATGHKEDLLMVTLGKLVRFVGKHDGLVSQSSAEGLTQNASIWFNTGRNHHHQRNDEYTPDGERSLGNIFERDIFLF